MPFTRMFVWVEGTDDSRFFEAIVKPFFQNRYDYVKIVEYAQMPKTTMSNLLKSIKSSNDDYVFVADADQLPCATARKERTRATHACVDMLKTLVVVKEIEGWYMAGLDEAAYKRLKIGYTPTTDNLTKEEFLRLKPKKFDSRIDFMAEILKSFSVKSAIKRNNSFAYFAWKLQIP